MNQNLQYSVDFAGAIWYNGCLQINLYSVQMQMYVPVERSAATSVALDRIKAFVLSELSNVVFIDSQYQNEAEMFEALGVNVCTLPHEPHDQIIGIMLFCKLNAITEGQIVISQLDISSSLGDDVWYQQTTDDELGPFGQPGWWHSRGCQKHNLGAAVEDNVVKVAATGWHEYDLDWPEVGGQSSTVVKPDFRKHETNLTR
jgi:hypothetical protein